MNLIDSGRKLRNWAYSFPSSIFFSSYNLWKLFIIILEISEVGLFLFCKQNSLQIIQIYEANIFSVGVLRDLFCRFSKSTKFSITNIMRTQHVILIKYLWDEICLFCAPALGRVQIHIWFVFFIYFNGLFSRPYLFMSIGNGNVSRSESVKKRHTTLVCNGKRIRLSENSFIYVVNFKLHTQTQHFFVHLLR